MKFKELKVGSAFKWDDELWIKILNMPRCIEYNAMIAEGFERGCLGCFNDDDRVEFICDIKDVCFPKTSKPASVNSSR